MRDPILYGRYLLLERLAIGGMAEVWLAEVRGEPGRRYAVKRLLPTLADDRTFVTMFLDEARIGAQLDHPGIVPVVDLGREGTGYFMAMEYVPGLDLRALLARLRHWLYERQAGSFVYVFPVTAPDRFYRHVLQALAGDRATVELEINA